MNINEATMRLREMLKKRTEKMLDSKTETDRENMNDYIALSYAVTAMEKQMPKKVKEHLFCPLCGKSGLFDDCGCELSHCGDCGQKLDWSESGDP